MSKVALFFPKTKPGDSPYDASVLAPLPLMAISAPLLAKGHEVRIFDARVEPDCEGKLADYASGAVCLGISCMTGYQILDGLRMARLVRRCNPNLPIVWGGYHPSLLPDQTSKHHLVSFAVRGQGEEALQDLVSLLEKSRADGASLEELKADLEPLLGVSFAGKNGEIVHGPSRPLADLDDLPPMPYEMLDLEKYIHENRGVRAINYVSSAGCLFQCGFCANVEVYGRKWSGLAARRVVDDLERLVKDHRIGLVYMDDNNFFVDTQRAKDICRGIIDRNLGIKWYAAARAEHIVRFDQELLRMLPESGFVKAMIGAESGSHRVLQMIKKGGTVQDILQCTRVCREAGIQPSYAYIYGFPYRDQAEHREEVKSTLDLVKRVQRIDPNAKITTLFFTPYPGTAMGVLGESLGEKMPDRLEDWAAYDPRGDKTPWVTEAEKRGLLITERIISFAYPSEGLRKALRQHRFGWVLFTLHRLAHLRVKFDWYRLPLEWRAVDWYRGRKRRESHEGTVHN